MMNKINRFPLLSLAVVAMLVILDAPSSTAFGQGARFFRISGPTATKIIAFRPDGLLVWTNALPNTNYTVQTATTLLGRSNWVDYVQLSVTNGFNTNRLIDFHPPAGMALIPAGLYQMGDALDGETDAPVHLVYVSGFYLDQFDVTLAQWQPVYNWAMNHGYTFSQAGSGKAANHPVQFVDWFDAVKWCNARSEMAGRTPAYYTTAAQTVVYRTGEMDLTNGCVNWNAGYRLPTEAEWEKAARGGASGQRFPWGDLITWNQADFYANPRSLNSYGYTYDVDTDWGYDPTFNYGAYPYTSPVGTFAPNGYGLYDTAGNLWQWCWDHLAAYGSGLQTDPRGALGDWRVIRGGSWANYAIYCRVACRDSASPGDSSNLIGFRSVLPLGQ